MATVQPFNRSTIENYLKKNDILYLVDDDGDFSVGFGYDDDRGCELTFWLTKEGDKSSIYSVRAYSDKRIPKSDWARAIYLCNTWNKERYWPCAYLSVSDPNTDTTGAIALQHHIDLQHGIHAELFDDLTMTIFAASFSFWEWAHKEHGL